MSYVKAVLKNFNFEVQLMSERVACSKLPESHHVVEQFEGE